MVSPSSLLVSALALGSWAALGATQDTLEPRGRADIVKEILKAIGIFTDDTVYTWNFNKFPSFCDLYMETRDGGNCYATVECKNGGKMFYKKDFALWDQCWVGGWTNFNDPRIGNFAISFRSRDGFEGQGLTEPILRMQEVQDWKTWDITALAEKYSKANRCEAGIAPINCDNGPFVCRFVLSGNANPQDGRVRRWSCGVPVIGEKVLDDMEWPTLQV